MNVVIETEDLRRCLAENVVRLRREKQMTQEELARKMGVHRVQLNRIENARCSPSAELLYSLADALGVATDSLRQVPA